MSFCSIMLLLFAAKDGDAAAQRTARGYLWQDGRGLVAEFIPYTLKSPALQQTTVMRQHTDLRVSAICGEMGVDWWDASRWKRLLEEHDVLVSTPQVGNS